MKKLNPEYSNFIAGNGLYINIDPVKQTAKIK